MAEHRPQTNILNQKPPDRDLYHYTSADGLKGVVSDRSLWATNIEYLNDTVEFKHGEEIIRSVVRSHMRNAKGARHDFFNAVEMQTDFFQVEDIFVISLSENDDLLSQWRGYTPSNFGFGIGFDPESLTTALSTLDKMQLVQCVYEDSEKKEYAKTLLDKFLEMWITHRQLDRADDDIIMTVSPSIMFNVYSTYLAAAMKHHAFAEEKEWRLLGVCRNPKRVHFRPGKSFLTPYIELQWGKGTNASEAQPIRSITVGPCPDPKLASKSVSRLLKSSSLENVQVKSSQIPFRSW